MKALPSQSSSSAQRLQFSTYDIVYKDMAISWARQEERSVPDPDQQANFYYIHKRKEDATRFIAGTQVPF